MAAGPALVGVVMAAAGRVPLTAGPSRGGDRTRPFGMKFPRKGRSTQNQRMAGGKRVTTADKEPSGAAKQFGDFAPGLVGFTDDVLFGQVWTRSELSPRDRSLVTVAALTTGGKTGP